MEENPVISRSNPAIGNGDLGAGQAMGAGPDPNMNNDAQLEYSAPDVEGLNNGPANMISHSFGQNNNSNDAPMGGLMGNSLDVPMTQPMGGSMEAPMNSGMSMDSQMDQSMMSPMGPGMPMGQSMQPMEQPVQPQPTPQPMQSMNQPIMQPMGQSMGQPMPQPMQPMAQPVQPMVPMGVGMSMEQAVQPMGQLMQPINPGMPMGQTVAPSPYGGYGQTSMPGYGYDASGFDVSLIFKIISAVFAVGLFITLFLPWVSGYLHDYNAFTTPHTSKSELSDPNILAYSTCVDMLALLVVVIISIFIKKRGLAIATGVVGIVSSAANISFCSLMILGVNETLASKSYLYSYKSVGDVYNVGFWLFFIFSFILLINSILILAIRKKRVA